MQEQVLCGMNMFLPKLIDVLGLGIGCSVARAPQRLLV